MSNGLRGPQEWQSGAAAEAAGEQIPSLSDRLRAESGSPDVWSTVARIHEVLLTRLDLDKLHDTADDDARDVVERATLALFESGEFPVPSPERQPLMAMVCDEVLGLGPLEPLLAEAEISEIMVNAPDQIFVERGGRLERAEARFRDADHIRRVAERILAGIGRRIDESSPMVDARLADGSRVNITIPPSTPASPTVTIRKFRTDRYRIDDLVEAGSLDERISEFLSLCAEQKINVLISGGTGSGKTTMLNAVSAFIPEGERIVTIEDPIELALQQRHVISMEARPPDMTGKHAITQRDLLRNALRMRPDRIIVGEIRGPEAFDMLQAMNTGHEGSLSTVHANTPRDALARVESMVLMAGMDLPLAAIREQIASALHLVVQLQRFPDGVRRVTEVTEVAGMEGQQVTLQNLFAFRAQGKAADGATFGSFEASGLRPTFADEFAAAGGVLDSRWFLDAVA